MSKVDIKQQMKETLYPTGPEEAPPISPKLELKPEPQKIDISQYDPETQQILRKGIELSQRVADLSQRTQGIIEKAVGFQEGWTRVKWKEDGQTKSKLFSSKEAAEKFIEKTKNEYEKARDKYVSEYRKLQASKEIQETRLGELLGKGRDIERKNVKQLNLKGLSTNKIEELIEEGKLSPSQIYQYSKTGSGTAIVLEDPIIEKTTKDVINVFKEELDNIRMKTGYAPRGSLDWSDVWTIKAAPLASDEPLSTKQFIARTKYNGLALLGGIAGGAISLIDPKTYFELTKNIGGLVIDPVGSVQRGAKKTREAILYDPQFFASNMMGQVIGSYAMGKVIGKGVKDLGSQYKDNITSFIGKTGNKLKEAYKNAQYKFMYDARGTLLDEIVQSGKIGDEFLESKPFVYGPSNIWDEFRNSLKLRDEWIPSKPSEAKPGILDEFSNYMKLRDDFIKSKGYEPGKIGLWDEFKNYLKVQDEFIKSKPYIPKPSNPDALWTKAKVWWTITEAKIRKSFKIDPDEWITSLEKTIQEKTGKGTPWYKTGLGMEDMPWPSKASQLKAMDFFKNLEKSGANNAVNSFYGSLIQQGVNVERASEMASNYAIALTAIYSAKGIKNATEATRRLQDASGAIANTIRIAESRIEKDMALSMLEDILSQLNYDVFDAKDRIYPGLSESILDLRTIYEKTGKIDNEKFIDVFENLTDGLDIDDNTIYTTIDKVDSLSSIKDVQLLESVEEELTEQIQKEIIETPRLKQKEMRSFRLRLYMGPKERYKVKIGYPRGKAETVVVDARGFPDAVQKAQRIRKTSKYVPNLIDVTRI